MAKKYSKLSEILKNLLFKRDMKPIDLARELNIPQPTIHRIVTGKSSRPYQSSLKPIADFFSLTVEQLIGQTPLEEEIININPLINTSKLKKIPIISWETITDFANKGVIIKKTDQVVVNSSLTEKAFATIMNDSSMEPIFTKGSVLIFDKKEKIQDRSYVLVKLAELKSPIFRLLLIDGEDRYLKPINPDLKNFKMRIMTENDSIIAVLEEARTKY